MMKKRGKKSRMNEQELNQQEPETVETPAEETAEVEVVDIAALTAAAAKADEYLAMAQRTQADFDNFRRRNESVRADAFAEGQRTVLTAMLAEIACLIVTYVFSLCVGAGNIISGSIPNRLPMNTALFLI